MAHSKKAEELMDNYLTQKAVFREELEEKRISRKDLMLKAGYTEISANANNPELSKLYAVKVEELVNKTGFTLKAFVESIERDVREGKIEGMNLTTKVKTLSMLTTIFKGLSPSFKQKSMVKDDEGNVKTVWTKLN